MITDLLTFSATGDGGLALVSFSIDGTLSDPFGTNGSGASAYLTLDPVVGDAYGPRLLISFSSFSSTQMSGEWINPLVSTSQIANSIQWNFSAFLPLGTYSSYAMRMQLDTQAQSGGVVDFGHTATMGFGISDNLQFASQSGVFNAVAPLGAVPEPSTWALMIGGFGLAGGVLRRRRAVPA